MSGSHGMRGLQPVACADDQNMHWNAELPQDFHAHDADNYQLQRVTFRAFSLPILGLILFFLFFAAFLVSILGFFVGRIQAEHFGDLGFGE